MKALRTVGLALAILVSTRLSGAQVLNEDVGIPLSSSGNPGTPIILIDDRAREDQVSLIGSLDGYINGMGTLKPFTSTSPGDLILTNSNNPTGGDAPSNWLADIRFFNPLDPNGNLSLPATETEAFFPDDVGPGGFASFQLMPDINYVPTTAGTVIPGNPVTGSEELFGPIEGINAGQTAIIVFSAYPGATTAATPEPGVMALLFGVGIVGAGLLVRRRRCCNHPPNGQLMGS
jgi:hypothetical protein